MTSLASKQDQQKLKRRTAPYWEKLADGQALGFRRGPDTWHARWRGADGRDHYHALKGITEHRDALREAKRWCKQMDGTAALSDEPRRETVSQALEAYCQDLEGTNRPQTAREQRGRFVTVIVGDPIERLPLERLTLQAFKAWRKRVESKKIDSTGRTRHARTVNRYVRAVIAGLNRSLKIGFVGDAAAWKIEQLADPIEQSEQHSVFLQTPEREALLAASEPHAAAFFKALALSGARPGELAGTCVADFDQVGGSLRLSHRKGRPAKLRQRFITVNRALAALLRSQAAGKASLDLLFPCPSGAAWQRHTWAQAFRRATHRAKDDGHPLPAKASTYALRHTRISELLQVHHIDPVTVAQQTGTSVGVIAKHYAKFIPAAMHQQLEATG